MFIVDHGIHPFVLQHFTDTKWEITTFVVSTGIAAPTGVNATAGSGASTLATPVISSVTGTTVGLTTYKVEAYSYFGSINRVSASSAAVGGFDPSGAFPVTINWGGVLHGDGYAVFRSKSSGSGPWGIVGVTSGTSFVDDASEANDGGAGAAILAANDGTSGTVEFQYVVTAVSQTTGIESLASNVASCQGKTPTSSDPNIITWNPESGVQFFNVYKSLNGVFGFIGQVTGTLTTFKDTNFIPDTSKQPPVQFSLFQTPDDYPSVVGTYQQRLLFANTLNQPQTVWASSVGSLFSFTTTTPVLDSSAIQFTVAGDVIQFVQALVDIGKLIVHTNNAEYVCTGNQAGTITPSEITLVTQGSTGCSTLRPVTIGNTDVFIQNGSSRLQDLRYEVQSFAFTGKDLTKYIASLFQGRSIVSIAWQRLPHSIVWCALDNGQLVGMTYSREDELWAWHLHSFINGAVEQVCVVTENGGASNTLYMVIRRTINGATVRYVEQFANRNFTDTVLLTDVRLNDASLTYDGRNTGGTTITATTSGGWTPTDVITLTASVSTFVSGDVGNIIVFQQTDPITGLVTDQVTFSIIGYTSATVVQATPQRTVPTWARATALTAWGKGVRHFTGIGHLEGQSLSILADGNVAANPLDPNYPLVTVSAGAFTLTDPAVVVTAGLPVQMDVQTLPTENAQGETILNKRIQVREVCPVFYQTRGGLFGPDFSRLAPWKQQPAGAYFVPTPLVTGPVRIPIYSNVELTGQVAIRTTEPLPFSISGLITTLEAGT